MRACSEPKRKAQIRFDEIVFNGVERDLTRTMARERGIAKSAEPH
jgi:hypothetical protein